MIFVYLIMRCELVYKYKDDFAVESKVTNIYI